MLKPYSRIITLFALVFVSLAAVLFVVNTSHAAQAVRQPPQFLPQPSVGAKTAVQVSSVPYTTAVEVTFGDPESLDPALDYETGGGHVILQVYDTLVTYNRDKADTLVPMLASGWTTSPDGKTYTFTLRSGVRFHNGATLTPQDVAYSFQRGIFAGDPNTPQWLMDEPLFNVDDVTQLVDPSGSLVGDPTGLQAASPALLQAACLTVTKAITFSNALNTVTFHLDHPAGLFLNTLAGTWGAVMSKPWLISHGGWNGSCSSWQFTYGTQASSSPIASIENGTGPFILDYWTPNVEIALKRNPSYWRSSPLWPGGPIGPSALERVLIKNIPDGTTRYNMFINGDADLGAVAGGYGPLADKVLLRYDQPDGLVGVLVYPTGTLQAYANVLAISAQDAGFVYNIGTGGPRNYVGSGALNGNGIPVNFFTDLHVRKAFSYAFNWTQYITEAYGGQAIQRRGPIIKGILGYTDTQPTYFFSPTLAMQEFSQAWGGQVISHGFVMTVSYNTGNLQRQRFAEIIKAGIEGLTSTFHVNVVSLANSDYTSDRQAHQIPFYTIGWQQDLPHPHNWVVPYFETIFANPQQLPSDQRAIYQSKIDTCVVLSGSAAQACYEDIQNTAYLSATDIFLAQSYNTRYIRGELRGYFIDPLSMGPYFYELSKGPLPVIGSASPSVDSSTNFTSTTGATATLFLPPGSVTQLTQIAIVPDTVAQLPPSGYQFGNMAFDLQAYVGGTLVPSQTFPSPITLTLNYNTASKGVLIENQLMLFWWNGSAWVDAACGPYVRDLVNHILQVPICHFSEFALGGITNKVYLPIVSKNYSSGLSLVSQIGGATDDVAVQGNYAYVGVGPRLVVLNINDPANPSFVGQTDVLANVVSRVVVSGTHAYLVVGGNFRIVDVSNPSHPIEVGSYSGGSVSSAAVAGNYAYLSSYSGGLRIVNISNPAHPVQVGTYASPQSAVDIAVAGHYAYVAGNSSGLSIFDVSNPANPIFVKTFSISSCCVYGVDVVGSLAYVVGTDYKLRIINVSNPASPFQVGICTFAQWAFDVTVAGNYAYVAANSGGIRVVDVSNPASPYEVAHYGIWGHAQHITLKGNYAYVPNSDNGLEIVSISTPTSPSEVGSYGSWRADDVKVSGEYAYIAGEESGLRLVYVLDPMHPALLGSAGTDWLTTASAVKGNYAYVASLYGLQVFDISNPSDPTLTGSSQSWGGLSMVISGSYAYLSDWHSGNGLGVMNISDPANPTLTSHYAPSGQAYGLAVAGLYAYVGGCYGFHVISIANPNSLNQVGQYTPPSCSYGIVVSGTYAYLADSQSGLRVVNISNPAVPVEVGFYDTPGRAWSVAISGNTVYVGDGGSNSSVRAIDVSDPAHPVEISSYDVPASYANVVAVMKGYIYVANGDGGLIILQ